MSPILITMIFGLLLGLLAGVAVGVGVQYLASVGRITDLLRAKLLFLSGLLPGAWLGGRFADPVLPEKHQGDGVNE